MTPYRFCLQDDEGPDWCTCQPCAIARERDTLAAENARLRAALDSVVTLVTTSGNPDPWEALTEVGDVAEMALRESDEVTVDHLCHEATKHRQTRPLAGSMWTTPVDPNRPQLEGAKLDPTVTPEEMRKAMGDARMRDAAKALVAKWPRCWKCTRPATHLITERPTRLCDACVSSASVPYHRPDERGRQVVEIEGAPELRGLIALLGDR